MQNMQNKSMVQTNRPYSIDWILCIFCTGAPQQVRVFKNAENTKNAINTKMQGMLLVVSII